MTLQGLSIPQSTRPDLPLADRPALNTSQETFSSVLARSTTADQTPEQKARAAAEQFVAIAFIQPLLKQLRDTNSAAGPFAPSAGEKQFQSLADAQVAQQITRAANFPLIDRLATDLLRRSARTAQPTGKAMEHDEVRATSDQHWRVEP